MEDSKAEQRKQVQHEIMSLSTSILAAAVIVGASVLFAASIVVKKLEGQSPQAARAEVKTETTGLSIDALKQYAKDLGLNTKEFATCLDNSETAGIVSGDISDGQSLGVSGTPTFFINGKKIVGAVAFAEFEKSIEDALNNVSESGLATVPERQDAPVIGKANAGVTIVEFSDFECPFCTRFFKETLPQIKTKYIDTGKAKLIYRHFPLSFHPNAQKAAEAGECASHQGKFEEYHDLLFQKGKP